MSRANKVNLLGQFEAHSEATAALKSPGDAALVVRGLPRFLLLKCPCCCGDTLVMNLDRRAGPAWRIYARHKALSVYPSYWRDSHCGSHFVIWNNHIFWCDWKTDENDLWSNATPSIENKVKAALSFQFQKYDSIADRLDEIPWEVLQACNSLVRKGLAECNSPNHRSEFRLRGGIARFWA